MTKKALVMLLILVVTMSGCEKLEDKQAKEYRRDMDVQKEHLQPEMIDVLPDKSEYQEYIRKIWVSEEWNHTEEYESYPSFYFTGIEDGKVEGQMADGEIVESPYYLDKSEYELHTISFQGDIRGNKAKCCYRNENYEKQYFTVQLVDKNQIKIDDKIFRPYHLTDIENLSVLESCPAAMKWGNKEGFYFNSVQIEKAGEVYPDAYLTDEEGNVLYHFNSIYQKDSEIKEILFGDENEDGFDDITIFTGYPGEKANLWIERSLLQEESGNFKEEFLRQSGNAAKEISAIEWYGEEYYGKNEVQKYEQYEELVTEIQDALSNGRMESLLQTGDSKVRQLSEHEIQKFCYLETNNVLMQYNDMAEENYIDMYEWYIFERSDKRKDILLQLQSDRGWYYILFRCTLTENGRMTTQCGMFTEVQKGKSADSQLSVANYFLGQNDVFLFCVPEWNADGKIDGVMLYSLDIEDCWGIMLRGQTND